MKKHFVNITVRFLVSVVAVTCLSRARLDAGTYQDFVKFLEPVYYYELNETDADGEVVDSMGNAPFGSFNGDYGNGPEVGVPGPDFLLEGGAWTVTQEWSDVGAQIPLVGLGEGNLAHFSNNAGHVNLAVPDLFGAPAMTVVMFAKGGGNAQGGDRLFTNNLEDPTRSFQINVGNDGLVVSVDPNFECGQPFPDLCRHKSLFFPEEGGDGFSNAGADRGLISPDNGWWHIVASTEGNTSEERAANIRLWLNGVDRTADMKPGTTGWGVNMETGFAKIGGRRADPLDSTTHSGWQDEVAIWLGRALSDEEAFALYLAATDPNFVVPGGEPCDFNGDEVCDVADLDELLYTGQVNNDSKYDLDESGTVDLADRDVWLGLVNSFPGDFDLNGSVVAGDLNALGSNWQATNLSSWAQGDSDGDGDADAADLNTLGTNWQAGVAAASSTAAVPEPTGIMLSLLGLLGLFGARRRR